MKLIDARILAAAYVLIAATAFAATPAIGVASAIGSFTVNSSQVDGNSNIFEGSQLRTENSASQIYLQNGASVRMATGSAASIYSDRFVLQEGAARVDNPGSYKIQAAGYNVLGDGPDSQAVVRFNENTVEVAALSGTLRVFDSQGALLTRVGAGTASSFKNGGQSGASGTGAGGGSSTTATVLLYTGLAGAMVGLGLGVVAVANHHHKHPTSR